MSGKMLSAEMSTECRRLRWVALRSMDRTGGEGLAAARDAMMYDRKFLVRGIAVLRLAQLLLWPACILLGLTAGIENQTLATVTMVLQTLWSLIWVTIVLSRNDIPAWSLRADVSINASA